MEEPITSSKRKGSGQWHTHSRLPQVPFSGAAHIHQVNNISRDPNCRHEELQFEMTGRGLIVLAMKSRMSPFTVHGDIRPGFPVRRRVRRNIVQRENRSAKQAFPKGGFLRQLLDSAWSDGQYGGQRGATVTFVTRLDLQKGGP